MFWPYSFAQSIDLFHHEWCGLLGIAPNFDIYAEELHDDLASQYRFDAHGRLLERVEEEPGRPAVLDQPPVRLHPPLGSTLPAPARAAQILNFGPALAEDSWDAELVQNMVHELSLPERMLLQRARLISPEILPPSILGVLDSWVTSEAEIVPGQFLICRRLSVVHRPTRPEGGPEAVHRYAAAHFAVLQLFDPQDFDRPLTETLLTGQALGFDLNWPTDVIARDNRLYIADSANGRSPHLSRIAVYDRSGGAS